MLDEMGLGLRLEEVDVDLDDLETRLDGLEPRTEDLELRLEDLDLPRETQLQSRDEFKVGLGDRLVERLDGGELVRRPAGDFVGSEVGFSSSSSTPVWFATSARWLPPSSSCRRRSPNRSRCR